ncbi:ATP-binding protein [Streptomyces sp. GMY02]|uniref:ATP-binding protein n=1 Tax=Streptomyces sp. GMY02 TaxID=1333528 RepID=UPI001C2BD0AB|nr:ATP-binding protein [Streptomyces sp. GMY02]QXE37095.1 ATP-binding protein [Streptomyces sp. GMY02]
MASTGLNPRQRDDALAGVSAVKVFKPSNESVSEARAFTRHALAGLLQADTIEDIVVCVSELATNAIQHGTPRDGSFQLAIQVERFNVRVECHDPVRKRPKLRAPSAVDEGGRGLFLVEALTSRWGVGSRPFGKFVWFEFDDVTELTQHDRVARA